MIVQQQATMDDLGKYFFCPNDGAEMEVGYRPLAGLGTVVRQAECPRCHGRVFMKAYAAGVRTKLFDWKCQSCTERADTLTAVQGKLLCDKCERRLKDAATANVQKT